MRSVGARRDQNEQEIIDALHIAGISTRQVNDSGLPDLITWDQHGDVRLIEVKSARGSFTPRQKMWKLTGLPVYTVSTPMQALAVWRV